MRGRGDDHPGSGVFTKVMGDVDLSASQQPLQPAILSRRGAMAGVEGEQLPRCVLGHPLREGFSLGVEGVHQNYHVDRNGPLAKPGSRSLEPRAVGDQYDLTRRGPWPPIADSRRHLREIRSRVARLGESARVALAFAVRQLRNEQKSVGQRRVMARPQLPSNLAVSVALTAARSRIHEHARAPVPPVEKYHHSPRLEPIEAARYVQHRARRRGGVRMAGEVEIDRQSRGRRCVRGRLWPLHRNGGALAP